VSALAALIERRIRAEGPISIADYMAEALLHPEHGYYTTRDPLGARGDFITAPEVSQIFGELLGLWCADAWNKLGRPPQVILAELGPGRGTLMRDALRALRVIPEFRRALRLHLVERSPALRRAQRATLADAAPLWHDDLAELPEGPLILIANEFLDALPVRQLVRMADGWHERRVGLDAEGALTLTLDPMLAAAPDNAPPGSVRELRPAAAALAERLAARLRAQSGFALFIDYGYAESAFGDTLQALRAHRPHAVLAAPGEADLTAHVDFAAFAAAARRAGARVWGPLPQGALLARLGLAERAAALIAGADPAQIAAIESGSRRLVHPLEMGALFKALALGGDHPAPAGFAEDRA